jgi:hypothetical protein
VGGQRMRVILHSGAASEIGKRDDDSSHQGGLWTGGSVIIIMIERRTTSYALGQSRSPVIRRTRRCIVT